MTRLYCLLLGYLFGNLQTSFIYGKTQHLDIREHGSGNAGTTNALRVMGSKAGVLTFVGDLGKMLLAFLICSLLFHTTEPDNRLLIKLYTGLGVVLGHDFPALLGFKGGKGIAVTGGLMLLLDWRMALLCALLFFGITYLTHYVSLASCVMVSAEFFLFVVLICTGALKRGDMGAFEGILLMAFWTGLALYRHRSNIERLLKGKENKLDLKKQA